jgi:hypothetical protein
MAIKVFDAGDYLMLSGDSREEVESALLKYESRGAEVVSGAVAIGARWAAACTMPVRGTSNDISDRLKLSDLWEAAARANAESVAPMDDGCFVEEVGFKRIITAPTKLQVMLRVQYFVRIGADLVGEIEQDGDVWVAIVDTVRSNGVEPHHWSEED